MVALMLPQLALLIVTGAAAGPGFVKDRATRLEPAVVLDAAGHASNLAQQFEGSGTEQAKMLIRSNDWDGAARTKTTEKDLLAEPTDLQGEPTSMQNVHEKQDQPCTPAMLIEYQKKVAQDPTSSEPAESTADSPDASKAAAEAESQVASKKGSGKEDDPCAQLAAKISPALAYGHVIVTEPDGNMSQVPGAIEDNSIAAVSEEDASSTADHIVSTLWMGFWVVIFCILLCIVGSRWHQEKQVKKIKRDKERSEGATGTGAAPKAEAAAGSSSAAAAAPAAGAAPVPKGDLLGF